MTIQKQAEEVKIFSLKLSPSLWVLLRQISKYERRKIKDQIVFFVQAVLPVAQLFRGFRLVPKHEDEDFLVSSSIRLKFTCEQMKCLHDLAYHYNLHVSVLLRDLIWVGAEYHQKFFKRNVYLTNEEFSRRINEDTVIRFRGIV